MCYSCENSADNCTSCSVDIDHRELIGTTCSCIIRPFISSGLAYSFFDQ